MVRIVILLALILLCGCGSERSGSVESHTGLEKAHTPLPVLAFPADFEIAQPREGSVTDEDVFRVATDFDPALPNNAVAPFSSTLAFDPDSSRPGLSAFSYCIYSFSLPDYDRLPVLQASWNALSVGDVYIGVSDWEGQRWKWFHSDAFERLSFGSMVRHIRADGALLLAIVCTGDEESRLISLKVGGTDPQSIIRAEPPGGFAPLEVELTGSASQDDQAISKFEWDLDGDGSFEFISTEGAVPDTLSFSEPGEYLVRLRVTDKDQIQDVSETVIKVSSGWAHTVGGAGIDSFNSVASDGLSSIYCCGSTDSFGAGNADLMLLSFDLDGNLNWARTWGTTEEERGLDLAIDSGGNVVTLANGGSASSEAYLLRWSPDGDLLKSKRVFDPDQMFPASLALFNDRAIVNGKRFDKSAEDRDRMFLFDLDLDNDTFRIRQWDISGSSILQVADVAASAGIFPGFERFYCVGTAHDSAVILECDDDLNDIIAQKLTGPSSSKGDSISLGNSILADPYVGGAHFDDGQSRVFVARWDLEDVISSSFIVSNSFVTSGTILRGLNGNHLVCGSISRFGWLHNFDEAGTFSDTRRFGKEDDFYQTVAIALVGDSAVSLVGSGENGANTEVLHTEVELVPTPLSWETMSITDSLLDAPQVGDFAGQVTSSEDIQVDGDIPESSNALIIFDALP